MASERVSGDSERIDGGLFGEHKSELPEDWHDTFDELTAQGKSPTGIKATIEYVTTPKSQREVAQEFGVSEETIMRTQAAVVALGPIEEKRATERTWRQTTMIDYCNQVADSLGWDEGVEYRVADTARRQNPAPRLRKAGWRSLYREFASNLQDGDNAELASDGGESRGE